MLVHPGGPFWAHKDVGVWSIAKGEIDAREDLLHAARRELQEETGLAPEGPFLALGDIRQAGGKVVHAFAVETDCDAAAVRSNTFELEWPPRSGRRQTFPEIDRAGWFALDAARSRINKAQAVFLDRLEQQLTAR